VAGEWSSLLQYTQRVHPKRDIGVEPTWLSLCYQGWGSQLTLLSIVSASAMVYGWSQWEAGQVEPGRGTLAVPAR
jgi:hypothetical protein